MTRRVVRARLGMLIGTAIVAGLLWWQGTDVIVDGMRGIDGPTLLAALGLGMLTTVCSAWRWCLVAKGLSVRLPLGRAVADYYRALFLNAALPGGVLGDVHRGVRHGQSAGDVGRGVRTVVLERVAGQVVLVAVGVTLLLMQPSLALDRIGHLADRTATVPGALSALLVMSGLVTVGAVRLRGKQYTSRWHRAVRAALAEVRLGLLARGSWPGVLISSVAVLAGHLGMFLLAARTAGSTAPATELVPLMVLALLAMALPLNVGGWGPREGVTAWAFGAAGMSAAQGLTVAVMYGLLTFVASLPGIGVLVTHWFTGMRRPQIELEESVLAESGTPGRRTKRVAHQFRAGEAEPRHAVAEQDRCHCEVEAVQRPRVEETRHGDSAALDKHAAQPTAREFPQQASRGERSGVGQGQYVDAVHGRNGLTPLLVRGHHPQGGCCPVTEHSMAERYPAVRIEDNTNRVGTRAGTDRQLGIVRNSGAGTDDHRVGERTQVVQMVAVLRARDVVGVAGTARDESVQTLSQLREGEARTAQAERQIAVGEDIRLGRGAPPPAPAVSSPDQSGGLGIRLGPDAAQPLPGFRHIKHAVALFRGATGHRVPRRATADGRLSATPDGRDPGSAGTRSSSGARSERYSAKESARPVNNCFPFSADAKEGRPITPDSV